MITDKNTELEIDKCGLLPGGAFMDDLLKVLIIIIVVIYVLSPEDAAPGPIDDAIVILLGLRGERKLAD